MALKIKNFMVLIWSIQAVLPRVPTKEPEQVVHILENEAREISCGNNGILVFSNFSHANGRENRTDCSKFIIGKINYHCKFGVSCSFDGVVSECLTNYTNFYLNYYCVRETAFHRACYKTIRADVDGTYGILTSGEYPMTKSVRECTYVLDVEAGYEMHLTVFDCYFDTKIHDDEHMLDTKFAKQILLRDTSVIRIKEKQDAYVGFLAFYTVKYTGFYTTGMTQSPITANAMRKLPTNRIFLRGGLIGVIILSILVLILASTNLVTCVLFQRVKTAKEAKKREALYQYIGPPASPKEAIYSQLQASECKQPEEYDDAISL